MKKPTVRPLRRNFTLAEIIVAMGVFSIIMLMLFRLFTSSQQVWSSAEARSNRYADARVAMDLMANALQSAFYAPDTTIMLIGAKSAPTKNDPRDVITFPVKMPTHYGCMKTAGGGENTFESDEPALFFIRFSLGKTSALPSEVTNDEKPGYLYLSTFGKKDNDTTYKELFTPYENNKIVDRCNDMLKAFRENDSVQKDDRKQDIIQGVTRLEFTPIMPDYKDTKLVWKLPHYKDGVDDNNTLNPIAVEVKLWLLDRAGYEKWYTLNESKSVTGSGENPRAKEFRLANEYLFTRLVYLPNNR